MEQIGIPDRSATAPERATGDDLYLYFISLVAAVGGFLFGYDLSIITGAVLVLKGQFSLTLGQEAWALGSASVGCILGPFLGPVFSDSALGRKWTLMIAAGIFLAGTVGTALARGMFDFNVYRILGGVGVGLASVVSPMYIAETSPARIRGRLVTLNQLAIVVGSTASIVVAYFLLKDGVPGAWRWMFASACVPGLLLVFGLFFVPHSPRWLVEKDRLSEARTVLAKTDGAWNADSEIKAILVSIQEEKGNLRELLRPGVRVALLIAVGLAFFQQWTGVSTMTFYAPIIYQKAGFTQVTGAVGQTVVMNLFNIMVTVVSLLIVDRLGRRPLLLWGVAGMCVAQLLMGTFFYLGLHGFFIVGAMYLSMATYIVSLAPLTWLIMSEIFPTRVRAKGMAAGSVVVWISTATSIFFLGNVMNVLEKTFGTAAGVFWLYAVLCFVCWIFAFKLVPETKGQTLEKVAGEFLHRAHKSAR
jgi:SP family arabinose:H+ symporter-like MFS transporter